MYHRFDKIAGHTRELQKLFHRHFGQWPDDFMHIAARTKVPTVRPKNHGMDILGICKIAEPVAQFCIAFKSQGVLSVGPVKVYKRDPARNPALKMCYVSAH